MTTLASLTLVITAAATAHRPAPIVRRHDRPDSAYVALARRFPAVGSIGRIGDATLIARKWVVTAAHVARAAADRATLPAVRGMGKPASVVRVSDMTMTSGARPRVALTARRATR